MHSIWQMWRIKTCWLKEDITFISANICHIIWNSYYNRSSCLHLSHWLQYCNMLDEAPPARIREENAIWKMIKDLYVDALLNLLSRMHCMILINSNHANPTVTWLKNFDWSNIQIHQIFRYMLTLVLLSHFLWHLLRRGGLLQPPLDFL